MTRNISTENDAGFTILEMLIVIIIMSTLAATYAPRLVAQKQRQVLATEVAKNITMLIDAAKQYHYDNSHAWPANIGTLQTAGYVNPSWSATHAFGGSFTLAPVGAGSPDLQIQVTSLPADMQNIVRMSVPGWSYNAGTAVGTSQIPPPGLEPSLDSCVYDGGDTMWGDLIMGPDTNGVQTNVIFNDGTQNRLIAGQRNGDYGVHARNATNLHLTADAASEVVLRSGNGMRVQDANGTVDWMTLTSQGDLTLTGGGAKLTANDVVLRKLNEQGNGSGSSAKLSDNNAWIVYSSLHQDGERVTIEPPDSVHGLDQGRVQVFVVPTMFEGAENGDPYVYPVTAVRAWAEPIGGSHDYIIHYKVQDSKGNVHGASGPVQWALVLGIAYLQNPS